MMRSLIKKFDKNIYLKGIIFLIITTFLFSSLEVVTKPMLRDISPFQITFLRFFIGGLFLLPFALKQKSNIKFKPKLSDIFSIIGLGILNINISMSLLQLAVKSANASVVATLISATPIFVTFLSSFIFKEKISFTKLILLIICFFGVFLVTFGNFSGETHIIGIIFTLLAALTFSFYTIFAKFLVEKWGSIKLTAYTSLCGAITFIPFLYYFNIPIFIIPNEFILHILYLGIILSGFSYITYFGALNILTPNKVSLIFFFKPIIATIFSIIFLGETISLLQLSGMISIITSLYFLIK